MQFAYFLFFLLSSLCTSQTEGFTLRPYPGKSESITGTIQLDWSGDTLTITYDLSGIESECSSPGDPSTNSCGIHIHVGSSCADNTLVQGHYWNDDEVSDPWGATQYNAATGSVDVNYGYDHSESVYRTFVVHDYAGGRVSCNVIGATVETYTTLGTYPEYAGTLAVTGTVTVTYAGTEAQIEYDLDGIDASCTSPQADTANSCGIHIHAGTSCLTPDDVLGHYYNSSSMSEDPWADVVFTETGEGYAIVDTGYSDAGRGHAFVIHDYDGGRVTCALLASNYAIEMLDLLNPYPGQTTAYGGTIGLEFFDTSVTVMYDLVDADPLCETPGTGNSCGLHIHAGTSCFTNAEVLGHYYLDTMPEDPWAGISFTSNATGASSGRVTVDFGYGYDATKGKVFVSHYQDASRATCNVIGGYGYRLDSPDVYPGYTGGLTVGGEVLLEFLDTSVTMSMALTGLDSDCASSTSTHTNGCGVHVHTGTSCSLADLVGGHYYGTSSDPWAAGVYTSGSSEVVTLDWGLSGADAYGRTFIVHNFEGGRIACFVIGPETMEIGSFGLSHVNTYPNYDHRLAPAGMVAVGVVGTEAFITYDLTSADPDCTEASAAGNSCGIHIHAGDSCFTNDLAGGHYWTGGDDPWGSIVYVANSDGTASGMTSVEYGYGYADTMGKTFVIHEQDGSRMTCDVLGGISNRLESGFVKYADYTGDIEVSGEVLLEFMGTSVTIGMDFTADPDCTSGADAVANSCGIHIHSGTSCGGSDVGGHYYDDSSLSEDPWASAVYVEGTEQISIDYGYTGEDSQGKVLVVHNKAGEKIACSIIGAFNTVEYFDGYDGYTGELSVSGNVLMEFVDTTVTLTMDITADSACSGGAGTASNSCGIHIHEGSSCGLASAIGGHYYGLDSDPWSAGVYTTGSSEVVSLDWGLKFEDAQNALLVVHDFDGGRISCSVIGGDGSISIDMLGDYPGYTGDLSVSGSVYLEFIGTTTQITYQLDSADPACTAPSTAGNSCGIHFHSGTSCFRGTDVSGHYYSESMDDPWGSVVYAISNETTGEAVGQVVVDWGMYMEDAIGHAFVIHEVGGGRISCTLMDGMTYTVGYFDTYPEYTGELEVSGSVLLEFSETNVNLGLTLSGVDALCADGPSTAGNSCGVHIHDGTSCGVKDNIGGHLYGTSLSADPWASIVYSTGTDELIQLDWGMTGSEAFNKLLVVHDQSGGRIACSVIGADGSITIETVSAYPGYDDTTDVPTGSVLVEFIGTTAQMSWSDAQDPLCVSESGPESGVGNSCGIHIHAGLSCFDNAYVLGHYYNTDTLTSDPWGAGFYASDEGTVSVDFGFTMADAMGRAFVIHKRDGSRMTCDVLGGDEIGVSTFGVYPGYAGDSSATGEAMATFTELSVVLSYSMTGLDAACETDGPAVGTANSCGVHLHSCSSCASTDTIGGHYYDSSAITDDPWTAVTYGSMSGETASITTGYTFEESESQCLVFHDRDGSRATCTQLTVTVTVEFDGDYDTVIPDEATKEDFLAKCSAKYAPYSVYCKDVYAGSIIVVFASNGNTTALTNVETVVATEGMDLDGFDALVETTTTTEGPSDDSSDGMATGVIILIVVGAVIVILLVLGGAYSMSGSGGVRRSSDAENQYKTLNAPEIRDDVSLQRGLTSS